jgi:hypothetical protein
MQNSLLDSIPHTLFECFINRNRSRFDITSLPINSIFKPEKYNDISTYKLIANDLWNKISSACSPYCILDERPPNSLLFEEKREKCHHSIFSRLGFTANGLPNHYYWGQIVDSNSLAITFSLIKDRESPDGFPKLNTPLVLGLSPRGISCANGIILSLIKTSEINPDNINSLAFVIYPTVLGEELMVCQVKECNQ